MRLIRRAWLPRAEIVTGERLQALADVSLMSRQTRDFHRGVERYAERVVLFEEDVDDLDDDAISLLSTARSLFVYTHDVDPFIERLWPRLSGALRILISHNSDHEIGAKHAEWLDREGGTLDRWFAQNVTVAHPRLEPIPIGISNSMWPHGNLRILHRAMRRRSRRPPTELIFMSFMQTHPSRDAAATALRDAFPDAPLDLSPTRPWPRYLELLGSHRFCACPRGNGIDTHRVWESLYLGVVPVVERSVLSEHWRKQGLPQVIVDDWREVTQERLMREAERLRTAPIDRRALQLTHYASLVAGTTRSPGGSS
jgi:hypothetical protein